MNNERPLQRIGRAGFALPLLFGILMHANRGQAQQIASPPQASTSADCPPGAFCESARAAKTPPPQPASAPTPVRRGPAGAKAKRRRSKSVETIDNSNDSEDSRANELIVLPSKEKGKIYVIRRDGQGKPVVTEYAPASPKKIKKKPKKQPCCTVARSRDHRRVGVTLRGIGLAVPTAGAERLHMMGMGGSLRFRPTPSFALEIGFDRAAGETEAGDFRRQESRFSLNALLYAFPRSFFQPYLIGGVHGSVAHLESDVESPLLSKGTTADYGYLGAQAGAGLTLRFGRGFGLSFDGLGFIRKRVDGDASEFPEFVDADRAIATNTSAGVILRTGLNFWW